MEKGGGGEGHIVCKKTFEEISFVFFRMFNLKIDRNESRTQKESIRGKSLNANICYYADLSCNEYRKHIFS